jgi:hypothetical protein
LPPSLADRFALQVTPPAPFTFELPETQATLARYLKVDFPLTTTRVPGFDAPISFSAKGGQIAPKDEGRTRVYAELPDAAPGRQAVGSIHSRILTNLVKHRVEITAVGVDRGRRVALTRTFEIDIRSAFIVKTEPALLKLEPGTEGKLRLTADRLSLFDGDIAVQLTPSPGVHYPDHVTIPRGQAAVDIDIRVDATRAPGRVNINLTSSGTVGGFEEELRGRVEIEVAKTPTPKKK